MGNGADRGGARERTQSPALLRKRDGGVNHALLVPSLEVAEPITRGLEGLADAGDVAVPEDAEHAREEGVLVSVSLD